MCLYGYHIYEECGHKGLEVISHCVECLWKAGISAQLWPCPEVQYLRHIMELSPLTWYGKYGYCKQCQKTYAMLETVSCRSFNDVTVPTERAQADSPSEGLYIYTPFIAKTVPELLGVENQILLEERSDDHVIKFPSNLDHYNRAEAGSNLQWLSQGYCAGTLVGHLISGFASRDGMTLRDQCAVAGAILQGELVEMWRQEFENRGMPWTRYICQARSIGACIGVNILEQTFWEEVTRLYS